MMTNKNWTIDGTDAELLAATAEYVAEPKPFPDWRQIGDRLHTELVRRELTHD